MYPRGERLRPRFCLLYTSHRMIGGMGNPWTIAVWQKVVEPRDGAPSSWELFSELADRAGKNAEFIGLLNKFFRVKEEYAVPMDQDVYKRQE